MKTNFGIVILAAGLGTRMKSRQAKVLHRAGGKTLIELVTGTATRVAPPDHIFVVVGRQAELVEQVLAGRGVRFLLQKEQLGTGHAVLIGRQALKTLAPNLLVLYGDSPLVAAETLTSLMDHHVKSAAAATVLTTTLPDPTGYGRILRDGAGRIRAIVEQKAATPEQKAITEINCGIYCFQTQPLFACLAALRPNSQTGEYYLTDVIEGLVGRNLPVGGLSIPEASQVLGINTRVELAAVDCLLRARKTRELVLEGVTIERPETVTLDAGVSIAPDTVLEPFVQVL
ncbi:MAG: NTP transferase domain-containing protein, partial [Acidobacteria bacterium]|nr:NTP transferase domain-containing protein [Acidobacteriota bacterium]